MTDTEDWHGLATENVIEQRKIQIYKILPSSVTTATENFKQISHVYL